MRQASAIDPKLTVADLATALSCSTDKIYGLVKTGRIPCIKIGSMIRFEPTQIEKWIDDHRQ